MMAEFTRDAATTAAIFSLAAASWFRWAQAQPPAAWRYWLIGGSIFSLLIAVAGGVLTWQYWSTETAFNLETGRTFGLLVGLEFMIAGAGAGLLTALHKSQLIAPWIALVIGAHFFPLARLAHYPLLIVVAVIVILVALVAAPFARSQSITVSAFTGLTTGIVLLSAAISALVTVVT